MARAPDENKERDHYIVQDYQAGIDLRQIARSQGISERRVRQILDAHSIPVLPRKLKFDMEPISLVHERIGKMLYDFRFNRGLEAYEAADEIGWSMLTLRKVEQGFKELELLDLMDIATYTGTSIEEMIRLG